MATVEITADNFAETIERSEVVLLDWWASWCGPCRAFSPIYEAAAARHPGVTFGKVNTESQPELAANFEIRAIPTLMAFREGILLFAQPGMLPAGALDQLITKIRELDMAEIRSALEVPSPKSASGAAEERR